MHTFTLRLSLKIGTSRVISSPGFHYKLCRTRVRGQREGRSLWSRYCYECLVWFKLNN